MSAEPSASAAAADAPDDADDAALLADPGLAAVLRAGLVRFHDDPDDGRADDDGGAAAAAIAQSADDGIVAGVGVRARAPFARGAFVCAYWGVLVATGSGDLPAASRAYALAANAEYALSRP